MVTESLSHSHVSHLKQLSQSVLSLLDKGPESGFIAQPECDDRGAGPILTHRCGTSKNTRSMPVPGTPMKGLFDPQVEDC